ncbi:MAG: hypothetical protein ABSB70_16410 [Candidatus Velthaea sp.]
MDRRPASGIESSDDLRRALAARAGQGRAGTLCAQPGEPFAATVAAFDEADAAYRTAIGAMLPSGKARAVLTALAEFRQQVAQIRARVRSTVGCGDFDPLDTYAPQLPGSHGDSVRRSSATDAARSEAAALRARVNEEIAAHLDRDEIERLIEAKRTRNAAFDRSLRAALTDAAGDKLATQLLLLVDGWY